MQCMGWNPGYGYSRPLKREPGAATRQPEGTAWQRFMALADAWVWVLVPVLLVIGFVWALV